MPTYRIPVSLYIEAPTLADAVYLVTDYLDEAAQCVIDPRGLVGVDVEAHQAEPVPDTVPEPEPTH